MANYTLRDLYVTELQDLYGVERQIIESLPAVISATHSQELRDAFTMHRDRTRIHAERLELLMTRAGVAPRQTDETAIDASSRPPGNASPTARTRTSATRRSPRRRSTSSTTRSQATAAPAATRECSTTTTPLSCFSRRSTKRVKPTSS
jgi:Domain of unknown function (DUF892)